MDEKSLMGIARNLSINSLPLHLVVSFLGVHPITRLSYINELRPPRGARRNLQEVPCRGVKHFVKENFFFSK